MPAEWEFDENLIAISKASPRIVWTGLTFGQTNGLFVSTDEGESFKKTNGYDQAVLGIATGIETHPINKNKGYALFSIADGPKILETNDLGQTWKDISGFEINQLESKNGFPNVATYSLTVMPFDTNQIWVGTEVGLFESLDGGISWHYADNGLPPVAIYEMKIVNDEVVLATQGRGLWTVSLPELEGYEPQSALISPRVAITSTGFGGQIAGNANLRSSYDSSIVSISIPVADSSEVIERIVVASNEFPESVPFEAFIDASLDTILEAVVTIKSFKDGLLTFDEAVLVEIGFSSDVNSPNFLDFVTVEATNDKGKTWINLDRYDSSRHEDWRFAIGINIIGSSQIIKSHQIGLSNFFEDGEVIYLRFRLESNLTFTAWGWMIDNLELKEQTTAIEDLAATVALRSFPNPFTDNIALTYELPNKSVVTADLYSIDGKLISNLIQATQSSGKHRFEVNTSSLAKGIYLCHFQINGVAKTLKWIKE